MNVTRCRTDWEASKRRRTILCQSVCLSVGRSVGRSVCLSVCLSVCFSLPLRLSLSLCLSLSVSLCLSLCVCLSLCLSVCLSLCLSVCLSFISRTDGGNGWWLGVRARGILGRAATSFSQSVAGSARPQFDTSPDTETSPTHTQHRQNPETRETSLPAI